MHSSSPSIFCAQCLSKLDHLINPPVLEPSQTITSYVRNGYNLPLSPMEITQIDTFSVDGSESLSEYDTAIAEIEGLLLRLKNSRDSLQRRCDSAQYLISAPIRRLPLDVLHEIFTFFCEMDAPEDARYGTSGVYTLHMAEEVYCPTLKLTWVCSFWRTFVQSCPRLWSSISVHAGIFEYSPDSFQILVKYLSHSAGSLLDFSFTAHNTYDLMVPETIKLFIGCSTRWRQAVLRVINGGFFKVAASLSSQSLEPTPTQMGRFPALEGLEIMTRTLDWSNPGLFFQSFSSCPRLRVVNLARFSWSGHNADFSCVTSLTLHWFVGKSFGQLLRRLPVLESLEVHFFQLSDDEDDVDDGSYTSSLTKLTVTCSTLEPMAWRSIRLPHLTDLTYTPSESSALEELLILSSVLHDSQCRLSNLQLLDIHSCRSLRDFQSLRAILDFIASQNSLTHLAIYTRHVDPFVEFLKSTEDDSYVIRNLRFLELKGPFIQNMFESLACSICDLIESRCTVLYSANGNPEISGLQVLTLNLVNTNDCPNLPSSVHDRLSLLKEAGFKFTVSFSYDI